MVEFLARRVFEGRLEFNAVPERFKDAAREILINKYNYTTLAMSTEPEESRTEPEEIKEPETGEEEMR